MKKITQKIAIAVVITGLFAFTVVNNSKRAGEVEQIEGIYFFYKSKPVDSYDILGTVKAPGVVLSADPKSMIATMIKRSKKEHPTADGIVFTKEDMTACEAIKFKN